MTVSVEVVDPLEEFFEHIDVTCGIGFCAATSASIDFGTTTFWNGPGGREA